MYTYLYSVRQHITPPGKLIFFLLIAASMVWLTDIQAASQNQTCENIYCAKDIPMKPDLNPEKTLFLIDGSSFLYRAYYGVRPLHTPQGEPVQAVFSFCRTIKHLIDTYNPQHIALVWDSKGTTERHELYPAYKATRQEAPSDLFAQKQRIMDFADLIGLTQIAQTGVEADDLLYSIAQDYKDMYNIVILSSDKDLGQMICDSVIMFDAFSDTFTTQEILEQKMGFPISKLPFYFSLLGDSSDNIPGVHGIGKKGATDLVQQFASLEDMYKHIELVPKERTRNLLLENKANAFLSHQLFLLKYYPIRTTHITEKEFSFDAHMWQHARALFQELNFKSLLKDMGETIIKKEPIFKEKGYVFTTVTTTEQLADVCKQITQAGLCALDTELDGLNPLENKLVGISLCVRKGLAWYIPFGHTTGEKQLDAAFVREQLKPLLEDASIKKYLQHAKFDMLALHHFGITVQGLAFDTMVAAHLVNKDWESIGLKALSETYLGEPMYSFSDTVTKHGYTTFAQVPLELATEYAAADAHQTFQLVAILQKELAMQGMTDLYESIELPLVSVLFAMEAHGIHCDRTILAQLDKAVTKDLALLEDEIISLVGDEFSDINLSSPKQISVLLFEHLKLEPVKKTAKKTLSTDAEVLTELALIHPVPGLILRYRELFKLKSTYIDALPVYINKDDGYIHTTFSQTAVATGRLSSFEPNLQNIPTDTADYGGLTIRSAFKPEPGNVFLSADYSQIELRVLAHLTGDKALVDAFLHNVDIHAQTASKLFDTQLWAVSHEQRQIGKRINFSILYGLTPFGLSKDLQIPFKDAKLYIEKYFQQYPTVSDWMENVITETKKLGYVTTLYGRRRYLPGIYEHNKTLFDAARRAAINTVAQGTAAEVMKLGMINLSDALKKAGLHATLTLQIHDELLMSVPADELAATEKLTKEVLEHVVSWNIPLVVTTRHGADWQQVTK